MTRPCRDCGAPAAFTLVYPDPEINSHYLCPRCGAKWDLTDDGSALVPLGSIRRERAGKRPD